MKYFFVLGNNPTLSFSEINSVLRLKPEQVLFLSAEAVVVDITKEIDAGSLIKWLGGAIKVGVVSYKSLVISHQDILKLFNFKDEIGKFNFGISYYGPKKFKNEKELAMEIKNALKAKGVNSRWVTSREKQLSSVVVEQNKLTTDKGAEIVIIDSGRGGYYIGRTLAVQPFKELSKRDYGRPARDDYSGMLPPKLAQMMINLATSPRSLRSSPLSLVRSGAGGEVLLDPFCGSGTVLTEAALMGYNNLIGCDKSEKAVADTRKNFQFTISNSQSIFNEPVSNDALRVFQCRAENLNQKIKPNSVDAIITEPYLGPQRIKWNEKNLREAIAELEQLYHQAVLQFYKILSAPGGPASGGKPGGRVVMVWPVFKARDTVFLSAKNILENSGFKIVSPLPNFNQSNIIKLTNRRTIIYGREGQRVWREIVILEK